MLVMRNSKITSAGADEPNEDVAQNQTQLEDPSRLMVTTYSHLLLTVATSVKIKL